VPQCVVVCCSVCGVLQRLDDACSLAQKIAQEYDNCRAQIALQCVAAWGSVLQRLGHFAVETLYFPAHGPATTCRLSKLLGLCCKNALYSQHF